MNGPRTYRAEHAAPKEYVKLLGQYADEMQDPDALFLLAEMNFYGNFSYQRNFTEAFHRYRELAELTGNSTAQSMVGFIYATGIGGAVDADQAKALLYHTFAAEQGSIRSEMTIAFRHQTGIGTGRNCDKAVHYYKRVADKALDYYRSTAPGGRYMVKHAHPWADESGGVYGEGASVSSSGRNAKQDVNPHASTEDIMEYLDMLSRKGDMRATFSLAKMNYDGSRITQRNIRKAQRLFTKIARQYWDKTGKVINGGPQGIEKVAGKAAAHIGRMYLRGEGWDRSYEKAATWFRRGIANGDGHSQYLMGLMYRDGLGVPKDAFKAANYFTVAADADVAAAQSALGALFLDQGELETAGRYFELAAGHGHIEAIYYLGELTNKGIGRERHCGMATTYYKVVAEAVEELHSFFREANEAYQNNDLDTALLTSLMAAEQGYETAQSNAALLLDEYPPLLPLPAIPGLSTSPKHASPTLLNSTLALLSWTRSAKQSNADSLLKMGDYYLSGLGVPSPSPSQASTCYHSAADSHSSSQALWNLGWMHENGIAVDQDFHMAKRYYDLALEMSSEAYLPVTLALIKLRARSYWNTLTRGKVNSIRPDPPSTTPRKSRSIREWIAAFLENDDKDYTATDADTDDIDDPDHPALDSSRPAAAGDPDDGFYEDIDDGVFETLIIVALAAVLAFLLLYRQNWRDQQGLRRVERIYLDLRQGAAGAGNNNNGAPPPAAPGQAAVPAPTGTAGSGTGAGVGAGAGAGAGDSIGSGVTTGTDAGTGSDARSRPGAGAGAPGERQDQERDEDLAGMFPAPDDPEHAAWVAGGVGH